MAIRWAVASGNWSSTATWNGGNLPAVDDDVFADGFTVTVNQDVTAISLNTTQRSGGTNGGTFVCTTNRTINANINAGGGVGLNITANCTVFINGSIQGSSTVNVAAVRIGAVVNLTVTGNVTAGAFTLAYGLSLDTGSGASTVTINGNVTGGEGVNSRGVAFLSNGTQTVTINGNVLGSVGNGGDGVYVSSTNATVIIFGNVTARGSNGFATAGGSLNVTASVTGDIFGSSTSNARYGLALSTTGTIATAGRILGGGSASSSGVFINGNCTYTHTGNVFGGSAASCRGIITQTGTPSCVVNGNVEGGSASSAFGVFHTSSSTFTINGNAIGGTLAGVVGIQNTSSGTVSLNGIAIASTVAEAVDNTSTGTFTIAAARHASNGRSPWTGNGKILFSNLDLAHVTVNNAAHVSRMLGRRMLAPLGSFEGGLYG
jgi:hypothetical protein